MADNIFDNNLAGTQRLIEATTGVLTFANSGTDNSFSIGPNDSDDYYRLTVSRSSNVIVKLNPQGGNLDLAVLDSGGNPILGRATSNPNGMAEAVISDAIDPLQPGQTYYIRVSGNSPTEINYALTVETNPRNRADIVWRGITGIGENGIWRMNGTQFVSSQATGVPVDPSWTLNEMADLNGDGTTDYLWQNVVSADVGIWFMDANGNQILSSAALPSVSSDWFIAATGDFNGDNNTDLVWQNVNSGLAGVWIMNGASYVSSFAIDTISGAGWYIESAADFNQDGRPDLFFRNLTTGDNAIWLMNGTSFSQLASVSSRPVSWRMQATGDFDGDGSQDLLWRDYATGAVDVWFLNQTTSIGAANVSNVDPSAWLIAGVIKGTPKVDLAGSTPATAFNIGKLDGTATYSDDLSPSDNLDYYAFTLDLAARVGVTGKGTNISTLGNFEILAVDGVTVLGSAIANGANEKKLADLTLEAGTYYVRSTNLATSNTRYVLDLSAEQLGSNLLFPTSPPDVTTFKRLDGTVFASTTPVSVRDPFTFDLEYAVTYTGGVLNQFEVGFFLSLNGTLDAAPTDFRLDLNSDGVGNAQDVAVITGATPDTRITRTQRLTLPKFDDPFWANRGTNNTYNIIVVLDPENKIQELDRATRTPAENDNVFAAPIRIEAFRPDLIPVSFAVTETAANRGSSVNITGAVQNIGSARSDAGGQPNRTFEVAFYLSRDTVFNTTGATVGDRDLLLPTTPAPITFSTLAAGATAPAVNLTAAIPQNWAGYRAEQPNSAYYILMVVDPGGTVNEIAGATANNTVFDVVTIPFV